MPVEYVTPDQLARRRRILGEIAHRLELLDGRAKPSDPVWNWIASEQARTVYVRIHCILCETPLYAKQQVGDREAGIPSSGVCDDCDREVCARAEEAQKDDQSC